jgi:predicted O-methyltransferase YrrM
MNIAHKIESVRTRWERWRQPDLATMCDQVVERRLSFLDHAALMELAATARACAVLDGDAVECGTALGGSSIAIAAGLGPDKVLFLHDVFGLIPPPSERDTPIEHERYQVIAKGDAQGFDGDVYYGYQPDLQKRIADNIASVLGKEALEAIHFRPGLFAETLNGSSPICFAHVDGDWYDSTMSAVERIWPRLSPGGVIVVDDYFAWDGCRKAIDDYFAGRTDMEITRKRRLQVKKKATAPSPARASMQ